MENEPMDHYTINYDKIINDRKLHPSTRLLAVDLLSNPYKVVGDFMREMPDEDLASLLNIADDEESDRFSEILLLAEMLARAEGLETPDLDTLTNRINLMVGFLAVETLDRQGLAIAIRENMSFGDEVSQKVIVKKITKKL